ncbi:hypothetical protein SAMN05428988_5018 [Chitinophaga sp. YR573]|nr:hypothetical protein SAMN05428988_5018 [Chitinophaga sp. YR573]
MNKVKILLSVIIILSTVGGIFAFKTTKRDTVICTISMLNGTCPSMRSCDTAVAVKFRLGLPNACYTTIISTACKDTYCPTPVAIVLE